MQVIEIDELTGAPCGLQHKPGKGIDLTQFGKAQVKRCTEVMWSEEQQLWYCEFRTGRMDGAVITREMVAEAATYCEQQALPFGGIATVNRLPDTTAYFTDYDAAVAVEVLVIQAAALMGNPLV